MLLIDADILNYRVGYACEEDEEKYALSTLDSVIFDILLAYPETDYKLYLTGAGNFRELVAVTAPYKGNRTSGKPIHYEALRNHLVEKWDAIVVDGMEADDAIATEMTKHNHEAVIVSLDKDFDQVPGEHYNFVKKQSYTVDAEEATKFLYEQILTGDRVDNIIGIKGIGPVKARKILDECDSEYEMFNACVNAYEKSDTTLYPMARVVENAQLLYLLREEGDKWVVPQNHT